MHTHSVFMLIFKQGIRYDQVTERWLELMYFKKYIFSKTSIFNRYGIILWGGEIESVQVQTIQKGYFVQLKGWIRESLVGPFLKS